MLIEHCMAMIEIVLIGIMIMMLRLKNTIIKYNNANKMVVIYKNKYDSN